ncbi:hypothetical protein BP6252_11866 [Coleophoma cylindrospora]|uniref:Ricin B lectin domain-containing protein n=1 Tax=Coleophoma cylindrospora TaxID=1849047 RepID=A0A3D8QKS4_9HELO|nr:hypothetical protein BP6252_11866 [Coleophoma cylindrospora]
MGDLVRDTRNQPGLEVVPPVPPQDIEYQTKDAPPYVSYEPSASSTRICGLTRRAFWTAFALVLVVIGAAIGGGVGGGLSTSHKSESIPTQQQSTSSISSSSATSITSSTTASTTSTGIPPSSTQPGVYRIINISTNTALDLLFGNPANGTEVECWQWNPDDAPANYTHQAWQIASVGNGAITIMNLQANSFITAPNNLTVGANPLNNAAADAAVFGGGTHGSPADPHLQWFLIRNSDNSVSFQSKAYSTKYLDLDKGNPANGSLVLLWESNGGLNQEWRLVDST